MSAERKALEKQRNEYNELKRQFDMCPLSLREQLQEQLSRVSVLMAGNSELCSTLQRRFTCTEIITDVTLYRPQSTQKYLEKRAI